MSAVRVESSLFLLFFFVIPAIICTIVLVTLLIVLLVRRSRRAGKQFSQSTTYAPSEPTPAPNDAPTPIENQSFPEILKSHRTARHMSQEFLAEQLGVTRQAVSKWESGTSEPSTANLLALAKLYGISLDELVGLK